MHIDAVLEIPYYTIQLPDGSRKRTNWDNLMTLSEYKRMKSANGSGGRDDDSPPRSGSRIRSILGFSSRGRGGRARGLGRSSSRGREEESERERSPSRASRGSRGGQRRDSGRRPSSKSREGDDDGDGYASDSSRRASRSSSTRGSDSIQGDGGGSIKGRGNGDGRRSRHGRPRSQSPFLRLHEVEESDDRRDRRSRSTEKHQHPSRPHPRSRSGRSPSHMAARVSVDGGTSCHEEKSADSNRSRTKDGHQSLARSGSSLEGNRKKGRDGEGDVSASDSNHCRGPPSRSSSDVSSAERSGDLCTAKKQMGCAIVVVEDVNDDTDDDDYR